jgi:hypothetical protein
MYSPEEPRTPIDVAKRNAVSSHLRSLVRELHEGRGLRLGAVYAVTNDISAIFQTESRLFQLRSDSNQYAGGDEIPAILRELNPDLFRQIKHWPRDQRPPVGQEDAAVIREIPIPNPVSFTALRKILEREIPSPLSWN